MHIPLALGFSPEPEAPVSREQGIAVQEEPVHLSVLLLLVQPSISGAQRGAADRFQYIVFSY